MCKQLVKKYPLLILPPAGLDTITGLILIFTVNADSEKKLSRYMHFYFEG